MSVKQQHVLIVGGMHRSGTSLTAGWLEKCGIFMGDTLIPPDPTNPKGHFEDRTISLFQREILTRNGLHHYLVLPGESINTLPRDYEEALNLVAERHLQQNSAQWGWKDPRTTLLLDFWKQVLPEAKFLFVFRPYTQVIDSLSRRQARKAKGRKKRLMHRLKLPLTDRQFARVWLRYNQDLFAFAERYPQDSLVLSTETLIANSLSVLQFLNISWGFDLEMIDILQSYDPTLFRSNPMHLRQAYLRSVVPELEPLYRKLLQTEQHHLQRIMGQA